MSLRCGKKRKLVVDHEAEKSLYGSFVSAANAVSTLYSQAVQQQRRASAQASRQALERVVAFLLATNPGQESISKAVLLQFLQQEYESIEGGEHLPCVFPAPHIAAVGSGPAGADLQPEQPGFSGKTMRGAGPGGYYTSPSRRQHSGGMGMDGMDSSEGSMPQAAAPQPPAGPEMQPFGPFGGVPGGFPAPMG